MENTGILQIEVEREKWLTTEVIAKLQKILGFVFRAESPQACSRGWSEAEPPVYQNMRPAPQGRGKNDCKTLYINILNSSTYAPAGLVIFLTLPGVPLRSTPGYMPVGLRP